MTIKKRLFWSNFFMIFVPVIATLLIGMLCVGLIWLSLMRGASLDAEDPEEFTYASMAVAESVEHQLENDGSLSSLSRLLDGNGMKLTVIEEGNEIFSYGEEKTEDQTLLTAAVALGGEGTISQGDRSIYIHPQTIRGTEYLIAIFGGHKSNFGYSELKEVLTVSAVLIVLTILLSVLLTNRFLIRFVFRKIEEPLDILTDGVRQIRDGNLSYRIDYNRQDEFKNVCDDFNEMAIRLKASVDLTQRQEQSRKELLAGISHDIRSPLTSIQAYVEGLLDGVGRTPQDQRRYLQTIKTKAEELDRLVSQLFLFSKMELGEYPENPRVIRLDEVIDQVTDELREEYEEKGMKIETSLCPAKIYADPLQMHRIISNILENSLKYKVKEQGSILILLEPGEGGWKLSFTDDGPGVAPEALPHLFEVFYREDPSRQNPHQGNGLGLAIVANAVRQCGGSVRAENAEAGGLRIEIFFPEYEVEEDGKDTDY